MWRGAARFVGQEEVEAFEIGARESDRLFDGAGGIGVPEMLHSHCVSQGRRKDTRRTYLKGIAVVDKDGVSFKLRGRPRLLAGDEPSPFG